MSIKDCPKCWCYPCDCKNKGSVMNTEIERKFLVKGSDFYQYAHGVQSILQGYIFINKTMSSRIRFLENDRENKFILSVKVSEGDSLTTRKEYEVEVSETEANLLLCKCDYFINKTRHLITYRGHLYEVDEFHDDNEGLIVAEIELLHEADEICDIPDWIGEEVTGDEKYYNASLAMNPYNKWGKQ